MTYYLVRLLDIDFAMCGEGLNTFIFKCTLPLLYSTGAYW